MSERLETVRDNIRKRLRELLDLGAIDTITFIELSVLISEFEYVAKMETMRELHK